MGSQYFESAAAPVLDTCLKRYRGLDKAKAKRSTAKNTELLDCICKDSALEVTRILPKTKAFWRKFKRRLVFSFPRSTHKRD